MINGVSCLIALVIGIVVGYFAAIVGIAMGAAVEKNKTEGKHE